jgi:hypothetical protein
MTFQITALPLAPFAHLIGAPDSELARHSAVRQIADRAPGFPCRVSLRDAAPGETLILVNYTHQPADTPYRASHAIYVRENASQAALAPGEIPALFNQRLISLRGFSAAGMMLEADVAIGLALAQAIGALFGKPAIAYIHLHYAKPGCYAARADRCVAGV